ncbi:hypothetical protein R69888_05727 [Paraburkholderia haematera]|uniref:Uncharacterized protein n=1 Tax=Paraburkholderia haematera TaxID=2793077 RepID=A0ABN7MKJ6_9BURK|nr:hypothetical protein R69888_05727 [Paraburkholderia haematera]
MQPAIVPCPRPAAYVRRAGRLDRIRRPLAQCAQPAAAAVGRTRKGALVAPATALRCALTSSPAPDCFAD